MVLDDTFYLTLEEITQNLADLANLQDVSEYLGGAGAEKYEVLNLSHPVISSYNWNLARVSDGTVLVGQGRQNDDNSKYKHGYFDVVLIPDGSPFGYIGSVPKMCVEPDK